MMVLDTLEVFKDYASPDLRRVIDEGITTTEHHLKMVKDLSTIAQRKARRNPRAQARACKARRLKRIESQSPNAVR